MIEKRYEMRTSETAWPPPPPPLFTSGYVWISLTPPPPGFRTSLLNVPLLRLLLGVNGAHGIWNWLPTVFTFIADDYRWCQLMFTLTITDTVSDDEPRKMFQEFLPLNCLLLQVIPCIKTLRVYIPVYQRAWRYCHYPLSLLTTYSTTFPRPTCNRQPEYSTIKSLTKNIPDAKVPPWGRWCL